MVTIRRMVAGSIALLALSLPAVPLRAANEPVLLANGHTASAGLAATCQKTASGQEVARVRANATGLEVKHGNAKNWKAAKASMTLVAGDWLRTKETSRAEVDLCDGGTLALNTKSTAHLPSTHAEEARRGELAVFLKAGTSHEVKAPSAQASGKGTHFDVRVERSRSTFTVATGTLRVKNKFGSVEVKRNQKTIAPIDRAPQPPVKADATTALSWSAPLAWQILTAPDLLSEPRRISLDAQGNMYVTDEYHNRLVKLSPSGTLLMSWGTQGSGPGDQNTPYPEPYGLALDAPGNIYVTDSFSTVTKLSPAGNVLATLSGSPDYSRPDGLLGPLGLAVDAQGTIIVADTVHDRIVKLSPTGDIVAEFGTEGSGPGQFLLPEGVAVDSAGNIYVADTLNHRIQKLSSGGQAIAQWGTRGAGAGQLEQPTDLKLDAGGNMYIADSGNQRIVELSPAGKQIGTWGSQGSSGPGVFTSPEGVALDSQGDIYVVDRSLGLVEKYSRPG